MNTLKSMFRTSPQSNKHDQSFENIPNSILEESKEEHKHHHSDRKERHNEDPIDPYSDIVMKMTKECSICTLNITKDENLMCVKCQNIFHEKCLQEMKERNML